MHTDAPHPRIYCCFFMLFMDKCVAWSHQQNLLFLFMSYFICICLLGLQSLVTIKISYRLQGKSQIVQDELVRLGESMVTSSEGTRALALELCREFEDKFLQHIMTGEVSTQNEHQVVICIQFLLTYCTQITYRKICESFIPYLLHTRFSSEKMTRAKLITTCY